MNGLLEHAQRLLDRSSTPPQFLPPDDPLRIIYELLHGDELERLRDERADLEAEAAAMDERIDGYEAATEEIINGLAKSIALVDKLKSDLERFRDAAQEAQSSTVVISETAETNQEAAA